MRTIVKNVVKRLSDNRIQIRRSMLMSFFVTIMATGLFVFLYQTARSMLVKAINNNSIALLQKFDLMAKIHDKMGFDAVPTIWEMQSHYGMIVKFAISIIVLSQLIYWMPKKDWVHSRVTLFPEMISRINIKENLGWKICLTVVVLLFYFVFSTYLHLCWMGGDDWYCTMSTGLSFVSRMCWWGWCWMTHVSRLGEMLPYIHPLTLDRWQHYLITPLFLISFPFIVKYMLGKYAEFRMWSAKGVVFYLTMVSLTVVGIRTIALLNGYILAATYVYGPIFNILYFALVFHLGNKNTSITGIVCLSLLAIVAGWYTEGIALMGLFVLLCYIMYCFYNRIVIGQAKYISIIFYFIGGFNVLFSPGPIVRGTLGGNSITGGNVPYNLFSLGIFERLTYIPEWLYSIYMSMKVDFLLIIVLSVLVYVFRRKMVNDRLWMPVLAFIAVGLLSALAYLVGGAIPNSSTYIPSCYMLCVAVAFLLARVLDRKPLPGIIIGSCVLLFFSIQIMDKILTMSPLKHYEREIYHEICRQRESGNSDVIINCPFKKDEVDIVPVEYHANKFECDFFKVRSIRIKSYEETNP